MGSIPDGLPGFVPHFKAGISGVMNQKDLIRLGVPPGETRRRGMDFISRYVLKGRDRTQLASIVEAVVAAPADPVDDPLAGEFAKALVRAPRGVRPAMAPWRAGDRGRGNPDSLHSASHGAGWVMSRTKAPETFEWTKVNRVLKDRHVHLISAGLDEVPGVDKDIHTVMAAQQDLVEVLAEFTPRLVKMAPSGERAED